LPPWRKRMKKRTKSDLIDELNEMQEALAKSQKDCGMLMNQIACIDATIDGCPLYILYGNEEDEGWSPQAEKVKRLWKKAHKIQYIFIWLMNKIGLG